MSAELETKKERSFASKVSVRSYEDLRKHVQDLFLIGKKRAQEALEREKILTYWQIGKSIDRHVLESGKRADYGKQVIQRLSKDLKTNETLLYYALQFARTYPESPSGKLTWSHYRALLPVKNESEREVWERKAEEWGWSSRALETAITEARKTVSSAAGRAGSRGTLYTYKISRWPAKGLFIDLGFRVYVPLEDAGKNFQEGDVVRWNPGRTDSVKDITRVSSPQLKDLYNYMLYPEKVSEAGFVTGKLELGFGIFSEQKIAYRPSAASDNQRDDLDKWLERVQKAIRHKESFIVRTGPQDKSGKYPAEFFFSAE